MVKVRSKRFSFYPTFFAVLFSLLIIIRLLYEGIRGGVWNILQIFFVLAGFYIVLFNGKILINSVFSIKVFAFFSFYIWLLSILYLKLDMDSTYYFLVIPFAFMMLLVFYDIGKRYSIDNNKIVYLTVFYIVAALFYVGRQRFLIGATSNSMMAANVYYLLTLLPIILVFTRKELSVIPFFVVIALVMLSGKRAGMLAVSTMLLIYYFSFSVSNIGKSFLNLAGLLLIIFAVYYLYIYVEKQYNLDVISRLERLQEDGGSGRDTRWELVANGISNSNFVEFFFGHGHKSTSQTFGGEAHNDFLQILFEYGFFAFVLYVGFYISMFKQSMNMFKNRYPYAKQFLISVIAALFLANFSFFIIEPRVIVGSALTWGLILADWQNCQIRNKKLKLLSYAKY